MSSDESDTNAIIVLKRETQFVPRSDDEEVLWQVEEITAERGKKYKVKWAGIDPATKKPWAQSWVAKHDCTDDLVVEWKAKKKRLAARKKRGGRTSTTSRASGSSKRAGSTTSGKKTRSLETEATSSRLDSVEQQFSSPPKSTDTKRKRQSETYATTSSGAVPADERAESSRPLKKQKMAWEVLLPPISSDEEGEDLLAAEARTQVALQHKVPPKTNGAPLDVSDEDESSPPKAKAKDKPVRRSNARSKGTVVISRASDSREESRLPHSKTKTKVVPRREKRVIDPDASQDEELRPSTSKNKSTSNRVSSPEQTDDLSEKEVEAPVPPIKIGPPRGVKRRETLGESGSTGKRGSSGTKPREDDSADERVPTEESEGQPGNEAPSSGGALSINQDTLDNPISTPPPPHISIPPVLPGAPPRKSDLSPRAMARLELFDRMMADISQPDAPPPTDASRHVPDDTHFNFNDAYDTYITFDSFDPPRPLSPPPSKSKTKRSKPGTPNGLIVPETELSGNSQSQSQSLPEPPPSPQPPPARGQSPRKPLDLPTIAVIAASATSSSAPPKDLLVPPHRPPLPTNGPLKRPGFKPVPQMFPNTSRSTIKARSHGIDSEPPPSSIESFTSPKRVDKGKQRAVEDLGLHSSLSEEEGAGERRKEQIQRKITDSELKKRGQELFDQAQLAREAERQKKKKAKRLKPVNEIVNGTTISSPEKGSPLPLIGTAETTLEMQWEELVDLTGGANSATLDTSERSEAKPLSQKERERLRIELRQEEEESTQEAMGTCPLPPVKESEVMDGGDAQMPPPRSPKNSPFRRHVEDVDHVEQPSADLQQASIIVQASQEQRHEDMDTEPSPANQPASSPPRPIPENLTDSPKRRLGEALSLLNVKSEEIQRLERELADARKNLQGLKVELAEIRQSSEPTGPVLVAWEAERAQWAQERSKWENDFLVWQDQRKEMSAERASLSARIAELSDAAVRAEEATVKLSELEAERVARKERDAMNLTQRSEELAVLTKVCGEYDQDRSKWEVERAQRVEEKARWETERVALQEKQETLSRSVDELTASAESLTSAKVSVERDRDFFREQYMQASGFVSSVREENIELENRTKIAEGQAQEGVAAIKALFEGRIKALQADIDRWKGLTELLQEKDKRTNDELRLRAAQVPELEDVCGRLAAEKKTLKADVRKLGQAQQRSVVQRNKLYYQILVLKMERASLKSKLSQLAKMTEGSAQETSQPVPAPPILDDPEGRDPNDMDILPDPTPQSVDVSFDEPALFPCMWRPQCRDQCQQIFDTKEDLERHVQEHFRDLLPQ